MLRPPNSIDGKIDPVARDYINEMYREIVSLRSALDTTSQKITSVPQTVTESIVQQLQQSGALTATPSSLPTILGLQSPGTIIVQNRVDIVARNLGSADIGAFFLVADYYHLVYWDGKFFHIADGQGGYIVDSVHALGVGYQLCDGSATDYLNDVTSNLAVTAFTTADETSVGAARTTFHRSTNSYSGVVIPATQPNVGGNSNVDSASVEVMAGTGTIVAAHTHVHGLSTGFVSLPDNPVQYLEVLRYFRR
jgi:hypothetical protein